MTLYFFWSQLVVIGLVMSGVSRGKGGSNPALEYTGGANSTSLPEPLTQTKEIMLNKWNND